MPLSPSSRTAPPTRPRPEESKTVHPLVSIVIPTYNRADVLPAAIDSVLSQTYEHCEIVLVDDGSTDGTARVARRYGEKIRYVYQPNAGRGAARNTGIEHAGGGYLLFLDSDDLLTPDAVAVQAAFLEANPDVDVVYANGYVLSEDGRLGPLEPFVIPLPPLDGPPLMRHVLTRNIFAIHAALLRRSALSSDRPFDESIPALEDWDLWLRLALAGKRFRYQNAKVAIYRRHSGNTDVAEPETRIEGSAAVASKVVTNRLDSHLPLRMQQDFRVERLDSLVLAAPRDVVFSALRTILWPDGRLSAYGCGRLARQLLILPIRRAGPVRRLIGARVRAISTDLQQRVGSLAKRRAPTNRP